MADCHGLTLFVLCTSNDHSTAISINQRTKQILWVFIVFAVSLHRFITWMLPKRQILDSSKLQEFADDTFRFDSLCEMDILHVTCNSHIKLLVTNNSHFSIEFSKDLYCRHVKTRACF